MKQDHINYFAVGLFVIAAMVVLMIGLYNITGSSTNADEYFVELKNVSGIRIGSPVTYAGYEVGKLADINPLRNNDHTIYQLRLLIKSGWKIPQDSTAQVVTPSLLSAKQIDITDGKSHEYLAVGGVIHGVEAVDMFQLAKNISSEFQKLSEEGLKPLIKTLTEDIVGTLPELTRQSSVLLKNLNKSATELLTVISTVDKQEISRILDNTDEMTNNLLVISRNLDAAATKIDSMVSNTAENMQENNQDIRKALLDLRTTMGVVEDNINNIIYNMDSTARNMNEFSRQLRDNPSVLLNSKPPADAAK
jgi:phospholipid/cholesterol/gamma-HCH transport system substrate-binding protein